VPIEVSSARNVALAGVSVHRRAVPPGQRQLRRGVPVTTVVRTLVDLGEHLGPGELGPVVDEALRRRLVAIGELHALHVALTTTPGRWRGGVAAVGQVLRDRPLLYRAGDSAWERAMDRAWDHWGLPGAVRQHEIRTPHGRYRPDRAIVELRIAVDRRADLVAAGWIPLDFTSRSSPERICRTVLALVAQRRRELGRVPPPSPS
jgi:hypothetical protein